MRSRRRTPECPKYYLQHEEGDHRVARTNSGSNPIATAIIRNRKPFHHSVNQYQQQPDLLSMQSNRSPNQCKGNPINLGSRNERRFPRKSQTDYKGSLKSANDSKPTPLVQIRLLLFWRLLLQDISSTLTPLKIETALSFIRETKSICQSM